MDEDEAVDEDEDDDKDENGDEDDEEAGSFGRGGGVEIGSGESG